MKNINLILYRTVAILLSLVLVTFSMVSGKFARYSTGDSGDSWADVASFNVGISNGAVVDNGLTKEYPLTISNKSEVRVGFGKLDVEFQDALPDDIQICLTDPSGNAVCTPQSTDGTTKQFSFNYGVELAPNESKELNLQITQEVGGIFNAATTTVRVSTSVYQID